MLVDRDCELDEHPEITAADVRAACGGPGPRTWKLLPYELDPWAQDFVRDFPDGANLDDMARAMGISIPAVARVLRRALAKLDD